GYIIAYLGTDFASNQAHRGVGTVSQQGRQLLQAHFPPTDKQHVQFIQLQENWKQWVARQRLHTAIALGCSTPNCLCLATTSPMIVTAGAPIPCSFTRVAMVSIVPKAIFSSGNEPFWITAMGSFFRPASW